MAELDIVFDPLPPETLTRFVNEAVDLHNIAATGMPTTLYTNAYIINSLLTPASVSNAVRFMEQTGSSIGLRVAPLDAVFNSPRERPSAAGRFRV